MSEEFYKDFFKLIEITIDISVFCYISNILLLFHIFFFSFDMPSGSITVLVVLPLGS